MCRTLYIIRSYIRTNTNAVACARMDDYGMEFRCTRCDINWGYGGGCECEGWRGAGPGNIFVRDYKKKRYHRLKWNFSVVWTRMRFLQVRVGLEAGTWWIIDWGIWFFVEFCSMWVFCLGVMKDPESLRQPTGWGGIPEVGLNCTLKWSLILRRFRL